jgi:hypothetical protein
MWRRVDIVLTAVSEERQLTEYLYRWFFTCGFSSFFIYPEDGGDTFL